MKFWTLVLLVCFVSHVCLSEEAKDAKKEPKEQKPKLTGKQKRRAGFFKQFNGPVQQGRDANLEINYLKTIFSSETATVDPNTYATFLGKVLDGSFDHPDDKEHLDSGITNPHEHAKEYVKSGNVKAAYTLEDVLNDVNEGTFHYWVELKINPETDL